MKIHSFTIGPLETNEYRVVDEVSQQALLIDPGLESEAIYEVIIAEGLAVSAIVNTHGHFDHVCGNAFFKAKTGAPVLIHREDAGIMRQAAEPARAFGFQVAPPPPALPRAGSPGAGTGWPLSGPPSSLVPLEEPTCREGRLRSCWPLSERNSSPFPMTPWSIQAMGPRPRSARSGSIIRS